VHINFTIIEAQIDLYIKEYTNDIKMTDLMTALTYQVYRIDRISTHGNSHGLDRDETWSVELDATFASEVEALAYVIQMNRRHCSYELGILYSSDRSVIARRCTDSKWCHLHRYFLGRPDMDLIAEKLNKDGITVLRKSKL